VRAGPGALHGSIVIDRQLKRALDHLEDDEEVLASVAGVYQGELLGADIPRNGLLIATERRLVFYAKKFGGYDFESFPYSNISSFEQGRDLYGSYVHFFASGNRVEMRWIQKRRALAALVDVVKDHMGRAREPAPAAQMGDRDVPARLRTLTQLYEEGVVTTEEYAAKKAELLRDL
jgi:Bacterial PH domain/Short C-terminal domain